MRKILFVPLVALLCACEPGPAPQQGAPPPNIVSITPREQRSVEAKTVIVELDLEPRFLVDYGERAVRMVERPMLHIGSHTVPLESYLGQGRFEGTVGPGLDVGVYDVRVTLEDGREATYPQGWRVKPSISFWIESIQHTSEETPIPIVIHAAGDAPERFDGTVTVSLYDNQGAPVPCLFRVGAANQETLTPCTFRSGAFSRGLRTEEISLTAPGSYIVAVRDDEGNESYSNSFRVDPKN